MSNRKHGMSVDVEDYFQVWALSEVIKRNDWEDIPLRVEESTRQVLSLFAANGAKATFFTLGWVAERCPDLIRDIVAQGHEIASHGYDHVKVFDQSPDEFRLDASKTKNILEDISGQAVTGYRAAGFSIDDRTPWAFEVLAEIGYEYSSSLHPIQHDHYNMPDAPRFAFNPIEGSSFLEVPVSTVEYLGRRMSCAGGGWFRAMPFSIYNQLLSHFMRCDDQPAVFYFHPWEVDAGQPKVAGLSAKSRFRHYIKLDKMEAKLSRLLKAYDWDRLDRLFLKDEDREAA